jgi:hypothetical protein
MTKISSSISHGSIPVVILTLLSILYIRLFSNAQNAIAHIATEEALGKHAYSALAGQCHQTLRLCSPLYANRLDGPAQRLRPRLALLLVLVDNHATGTTGRKELTRVVPCEAGDGSADVESHELVELAKIPDDGAGLVLVCGCEPCAVFGE